ncbi:MAG: peptide-binding protein [bacterium]
MKKSHKYYPSFKVVSISVNLLFCLILFLSMRTQSASVPEQRGGTVFIGMKGDFDSLNELTAADSDALQVIQNMLFMTLTRLNENLQFEPYLAERWEFSRGDSVLTYYLRRDVAWSDGHPTTAEDVRFTYALATNPKVAYPASSRFDLTESVEVLDDYTVRFRFKKPYPDALFDTQIPILPKHILEDIPAKKIAEAGFNRQPVGNGPFKLAAWKGNQNLVFVANPAYTLGRPSLDRVVFQIIPDETVLLTNLQTGALDIVPSLTPTGFKQIQNQKSLRAVRYSGRGFSFVGWNLTRPLFSKPVRQALTYAIHKQEIIVTLFEGFAAPAKGPLLPFVWAFDEDLPDFQYDPEKARQILQQEGWSDSDGDGILDKAGQPFEFTIKTNAGSQTRKDAAIMIQAQLRNIGVKAQVETVEWNLFIEQVFEQKDFDAVILGWDTDFTVNPTDLWHSSAIENGYNFVSYSNPKVDSLLEQGRNASRRHLAKPFWHEFQRIILEDSPYTFLFIPEKLAGVSRRIQNVKMDARGFLANVSQWRIPEHQRKYRAANH